MEILNFDDHAKQKHLLEACFSNKYSFILFGGAIRGGKSYGALGTSILLHKAFPGSRSAVVRTDTPTLKRNTLPTWNKLKPPGGKETQGPYRYEYSNGSEMMFFPESYNEDKELNRWRGLEVNFFILEELNEMQEVSFWKAFERVGSYIIPGMPKNKQPKPLIIATCNPTQNWVKDLIYDPWKKGELRSDWLYIPSKITDNTFLPNEYIQNLKSMPRYQYEVFVEGNWDVRLMRGGEFYKCFDLDSHIKRQDYDSEAPLHISFDFNVFPGMHLSVCQIEGKHIRVIDEVITKTPRNNTVGLCQEFLKKYGNHGGELYIYGDPSGRAQDTRSEDGKNDYTIIDGELKAMRPKSRVAASAPNVATRGAFINAILDKKLYDIDIAVDPECKKTIEDFTNVKEASDGSKHKAKERDPESGVSYEPYGHLSDCLDYLICAAFPDEFSKFKSGGQVYIPRGGKFKRSKARGSR